MRFFQPTMVEAAVALLAEDDGARCLAGGATLVAMMNADLIEPSALVSLVNVDALRGIARGADGEVVIGAMTTHRDVAIAPDFDPGQAIVRAAARTIGHPAIRNMGTIGGAICHADPAADYPAALVAAGAVVRIAGADGTREVAADDFFVDYLETAIEPGELVTGVRLPPSPAGAAASYEKFARVEGDFATASAAVVLAMEDGACSAIRLAVGGCGPTPVRVEAAEAALRGTRLDDGAVGEANALLMAACDPVDDFRGTSEYRLMLAPELVRRAVAAAKIRSEAGQ